MLSGARSRFLFLLAIAVVLLAGLAILAEVTLAQEAQEQAGTPKSPDAAQVPLGQVAVIYADGRLTIKANHAPLTEILRQASAQLSAQLDLSIGGSEPIDGVFGPGPAKKVIAALLEWTPYNYIIVRSADDPDVVVGLIVLPKTSDSTARPQLAANAQPPQLAANAQPPQLAANVQPPQPITPTAESEASPPPPSRAAALQQVKELIVAAKNDPRTYDLSGVDALAGDERSRDSMGSSSAAAAEVMSQLESILDSALKNPNSQPMQDVSQDGSVPGPIPSGAAAAGSPAPPAHRRRR